jgi:hypothetical protein
MLALYAVAWRSDPVANGWRRAKRKGGRVNVGTDWIQPNLLILFFEYMAR